MVQKAEPDCYTLASATDAAHASIENGWKLLSSGESEALLSVRFSHELLGSGAFGIDLRLRSAH